MRPSIALLSLPLALLPHVSAHCKITSATGSSGGSSTGLGITAGSGNSESDVTIFRGGNAPGFGRTTKGGTVDPSTAVPAAMKLAGSSSPPQVAPGGSVQMTMHVVNADGAGPMKCYVSTDASGSNWQEMTVSQNVPGFAGLNAVDDKDYPMTVQMPQGASCTGQVGGMSGMCMVKCQNPIGPFGGTVPVQMAGAGGDGASASAGTGAVGAASAAATPAAAKSNNNAAAGNEASQGLGGLFGDLGKKRSPEPQITGDNLGEELGNFGEDIQAVENVFESAGGALRVRSILEKA